MRWPLLADHLVRESTGQTSQPLDDAVAALLLDKNVQEVIAGSGLSAPLTLEAIARFAEAEATTMVERN